MLFFNILKKFPSFIVIIGSLIFFQALTIYDKEQCQSKFASDKGRHCYIFEKTKFSYFGNFIVGNFKNFNKFLLTKNRSGAIALNLSSTKERFKDKKAGFNFYYKRGTRPNAGFLLLAAGDPSKDGEPLIELWDLNNQIIVHKWDLKIEELIEKQYRTETTRLKHPLILRDGSLIVTHAGKNYQLIKISPDGRLINKNIEYGFHHSLEKDQQDKIYAPIYKDRGGKNDGFVILDKNLNITKKVLLEDIYKKSNLEYLYHTPFPYNDPFHLNDVQPLNDINETNIVFMSLRHQSSLLAYDFKDGKLIWILNGYGKMQHDIDVLDNEGTYISFFDNNALGSNESKGNIFTTIKNLPSLKNKNNELLIFNFSSSFDKEKGLLVKKEEFQSLDKNLIPNTSTQGLSEIIFENDSIFIEETNHGRLLEYDFKTRKLLWEYINRNDKTNNYYMMSWSRRMLELPKYFKKK